MIQVIIICAAILLTPVYAQDSNITNIHIEQQYNEYHLVWEQTNASKIKISQESPIASIDGILFALPGVNSIMIEHRTMLFDSYDNTLYGPFDVSSVYIPIAARE